LHRKNNQEESDAEDERGRGAGSQPGKERAAALASRDAAAPLNETSPGRDQGEEDDDDGLVPSLLFMNLKPRVE
jgi:hypothetical protein